MSCSKVLVFSATGRQGSGVVDGLVKLGIQVRGVTRSLQSEKSIAFRTKYPDAELVEIDFSSVESLIPVFEECDGVFLNMDYWTMGAEEELRIGYLVMNAMEESKMSFKLFIYSSLEAIGDATGIPCPHFDGKAKLMEYARTKREEIPCGFVKYSFYYSNLLSPYGGPKVETTNDGGKELVFRYPLNGTRLAMVPVHDAGRVVAKMFQNPSKYENVEIGLCGEFVTGNEIASIVSEATGITTRFEDIPIEGPPANQAMWKFKQDNSDTLYKQYHQDSTTIVDDIQSLKQWLLSYGAEQLRKKLEE